LNQSASAIEAWRSQAVTSQLEIDDKQSRLAVLQGEIANLRQTLDQENAASAERDEVQTKLGQVH
jgi:hypothetical protein